MTAAQTVAHRFEQSPGRSWKVTTQRLPMKMEICSSGSYGASAGDAAELFSSRDVGEPGHHIAGAAARDRFPSSCLCSGLCETAHALWVSGSVGSKVCNGFGGGSARSTPAPYRGRSGALRGFRGRACTARSICKLSFNHHPGAMKLSRSRSRRFCSSRTNRRRA